MKKFKKIISLLLSTLAVVSVVGMAACKGKQDTVAPPNGNAAEVTLDGENPMLIPSDLKYTDSILVNNGKTDYTIVLPENRSDFIGFAAQELQDRWKESTGGRIAAVGENEVNTVDSGKYIFIGKTKFLPSGMDISENATGVCGYTVRTYGDDVFIAGKTDRGSLNGVYAFLKNVFNYKYYAPDVWQINDCADGVFKLPLFDLTEKPDIQTPIIRTEVVKDPTESGRRLRVVQTNEAFVAVGGGNYHVALNCIPKDVYCDPNDADNYHPEWYMTERDGGEFVDGVFTGTYKEASEAEQPCYTAHGNKESYDLMVDAQVEILKESILKEQHDPDHLMYVWYTHMDKVTWCECKTCLAEKEKYGAVAPTQIKMANDIAAKIAEWVEQEGKNRRVLLVIYAYMSTIDAPKVIDDDIMLADNISLFYAPIEAAGYRKLSDPVNKYFVDNLEQWSKLTSDEGGLLFWSYDHCYFGDYLVPFYSFDTYQSNTKLLLEHNVKLVLALNEYDNYALPDWGFLKAYLHAELMWDSDQNVKKLIDDFFNVYFRSAASNMRKYFNRFSYWESYAQTKFDYKDGYSTAGRFKRTEEYYPYNELMTWLGYADEAYKDIEIYATRDPKLYALLKDRICLETISPRYLLTDLHQGRFTTTEYNKLVSEYNADRQRIGVNMGAEGGSVRWPHG